MAIGVGVGVGVAIDHIFEFTAWSYEYVDKGNTECDEADKGCDIGYSITGDQFLA
jgi:hypothetical protein